MSRTGRALLLALCAVVTPSAAQDSVIARLRTRADSLLQEWRQAARIADLVDSLERERAGAGRDTIAVGALRIVSNPSPLPLREAAARAWPVIDSLYGSGAAALARRPYLIRAVDPDTTVRRPALHVGMAVPWDLDVEAVTALLLANVPVPPLDAALAGWLGSSVRPSGRAPRDRASVYMQLVTAPSQTARRCFLGDIGACEAALELRGAGQPLEQWYPSPAERHELATRSLAGYFNHGPNAPTFQTCLAGSDRACTELLRTLPPSVLPKPLGTDARVTLVHTALRLGGRQAYPRLLANPSAPMRDRLAAAAGVAVDTVIARWRADVLESRPRAVTLPTWTLSVALGWMAFFAACGMRSSRWRL